MASVVVLLVVTCLAFVTAWDNGDDPPTGVAVDALLGRPAALPCDIEPSTREDRVYMVLWFRDAAGKPLYTFDARGRTMSKALYWSDSDAFGPRAYLVTASRPAVLTIDAVRLVDEGVYRCRVDFKNSPTRNVQVNLTVVVPPDQLVVYDGSGQPVSGSVIGPIAEGSELVLTCHVKGGKPPARVLWLVNDELAAGVQPGLAVSRLAVGRAGRELADASYRCQATNSRLLPPVHKTMRLQLHLAPVSVTVRDKPQKLVAGQEVDLTCEVTGSKPAPVVTWWLGDSRFTRAQVEEAGDATLLVSRARFVPQPADEGRALRCRAENPLVPSSAIEDSLVLDVVYPPQVSLQLGNTLNPDNIKEGDDVYFECDIRASPREHRIVWLHDGGLVMQNISAGVIVSTRSLVLQGVSRNSSGTYTCTAANTQGEASSQPVTLGVRFTPICKNSETHIVGMSPGETVELLCSVVAEPAPVTFEWQCNSGGEVTQTSSEKGTSQLSYTVTTDRDYGTVACWAGNRVGRQLEPCVFQLVPAVKPSPLENCTLRLATNGSEDMLEVECLAGYDGGLSQVFVLEAYESRTTKMLLNITAKDRPLFHINLGELQHGSAPSSHLLLYAINPKGRGEPFVLEDIAPSDAEKRTEPMAGISSAGLYTMPLAAALVGSVLIVAITVFLVATTFTRRQHCPSHAKAAFQRQQRRDKPTLQASTMLGKEQYVMSYTVKSMVTVDCKPDILKPSRDGSDHTQSPTPLLDKRKADNWQSPMLATYVFPSVTLPSQSNSSFPETQFPHSRQCHEHYYSAKKLITHRHMPKEYFIENSIPGPESCV